MGDDIEECIESADKACELNGMIEGEEAAMAEDDEDEREMEPRLET